MSIVQAHISIDDVAEAGFREHLRRWFDQRDAAGGLPDRSLIDPFMVPALAESVILFEVGEDLSPTYRLTGEAMRRAVGRPTVGLTPYDLMGRTPYAELIVEQLRDCARAVEPIYSSHDFVVAQDEIARESRRIAMPYGQDGKVNRLLCFQVVSEKLELKEGAAYRIDDWSLNQLAFVDPV
ncbi:MAG: hypothetical protein TEF_05200 [Rhizobiales bacterium NRL2]|jgi:hypothetical protein|nr:MAG: hypothetical protein TEF_05200 [Rhizobiales bacterium NRL2]